MGDRPRDRKYAFIDAEEGEEGIWTKEGLCLPIASGYLPVTENLGLRIIDWQRRLTPSPDDSPAFENFSREGLELAREVKAALPDWTIEYWDWHRYVEAQQLGITDKSHYEHEVTLPDDDKAEPSSLETEKWVRIMCDYATEGVWNKDGESCCLDELPVPQELADRLEAWQEDYSSAVDLVYEAEGGPDFTIMRQGMSMRSVEGLAIAKAVKAALPDWTIIYFDEEKWQNYRDTNRNLTFISDEARSSFQYPIAAEKQETD